MTFNSLDFLVFFPLVTAAYFLTPHRFKWILLLLASCVFYISFIPAYILVLFFLILIDYLGARRIEIASGPKRRFWLLLSIFSTLSAFFVFKYFNFFNANMTALASFLDWNYSVRPLQWILPLGISFHTFQGLSYVIEVYRGKWKAERHLGIYALYVMFYPQLVAGPIERPQHLLPQFREEHFFRSSRVAAGLSRMLWGFFKKVVIADNLAVYVNQIYGDSTAYSGWILAAATMIFAIQIYADFSAYTDIALGAAKVMGFKLRENFNVPYLATSISDFWRRWHMSLSTWFRDYVYIPLGGNRVTNHRWIINIFIVFLLSGLWHGANWTFAIWGGWHALCLIVGHLSRHWRSKIVGVLKLGRYPRLHRALQIAFTFVLVSFGWIFFRAENLSQAGQIITAIVADIGSASALLRFLAVELAVDRHPFLLMALFLLGYYWLILGDGNMKRHFLEHRFWSVRATVLSVLVWLIILVGAFDTGEEFIYFAF